MTRILHTSDWHLGKKLYKKERWPEQVEFLNWLVQSIIEKEVEILIIAGDIFDTPMPPTYALKGLFNFYKNLESIDCLKKIFVIGGNHDSGKLIETPIPLLNEKFHILGRPTHHLLETNIQEGDESKSWADKHKITLPLETGINLNFGLFPFFRSSDILLPELRNADELSPDKILLESIKAWLEAWKVSENDYNILIGHHLFGSFFESGSEQGVGLSGLASIPLSIFDNWDLLCLGHIHRPQCLRKERPLAYYSGSPIPMRFSEKEMKSVLLYDLDEKVKKIETQILPIPCFRALLQIEAKEDQWENLLIEELEKSKEAKLPAYAELTIHFDTPRPSYIDYIRERISSYEVELLNYFHIVDQSKDDHRKEKTLNAQTIQSSRMDELFELFLDSENVAQEQKNKVKQTYQRLMEEIDQSGEHYDVSENKEVEDSQ